MWEKIRVIFTIPELRNKILLTLLLIAIYRIGWQIPLPMIDQAKTGLASSGGNPLGKMVEMAAMFSASDLSSACLLYTSPSPRDKRQSRMPSSA